MEILEIKDGWKIMRARIMKGGGVYVDLPTRFGQRGAEFRESIVLENRGWRFTSTQDGDIDYIFHVWLKDDGSVAWANDMTHGIEYVREKYNPNYPNCGYLNDTLELLYKVSQEVRAYQKRELPVRDLFETRKRYLDAALKILGYDSIDAVAEGLDPSKGCLGLTKVVDELEKYRDLSIWVYSLGKAGDYDQMKCRATDDETKEDMVEYYAPVKEQVEQYVEFIERRAKELEEKRRVLPGYKLNMKDKMGEFSYDAYEAKVKSVAMLLLELNADLLTNDQKAKFGFGEFVVVDDITIKDRISSLIDSEEFNTACRLEDEFAYAESQELVERMKVITDEELEKLGLTREDVVRLLSGELEDLEERQSSVDNQEKIRKKYYSKVNRKPKAKSEDDEIIY